MKQVIGVIGAGYMAQIHFEAYRQMKIPVAMVADTNAKSADAAAAQFGAKAVGDWRELIDNREINTVAVFTPSAGHFEPAKAALEAGKHVISEKTLTLDYRQSLELGRIAEKENLILFTSYMKRFFPAVQKAKQLLPRLGHIMSVYCRTYQGVGTNMHTGEPLSFFKPDATGVSPIVCKSGGGILVCGGSHIFDLLHYFVGKPVAVYGRSFIRPGFDADYMHHSLFDLTGGGVGHFEGNWHPLKRIGYEQVGWDETFEINGVNGRLVLNFPEWNKPLRTPATLAWYDNETEAWTEFCFDRVDPFVEAEKHFQAQIAKGEQGEHDRYTGYRTDYLLAMAAQSAKENRRIELAYEA